MPGLGQLYCLRVGSFFAWLLLTVIAYAAFFPVGLVLHVLAIVHAFQLSQNPLGAPEHRTSVRTKAERVKTTKIVIGSLVAVGVLVVIAIVTPPSRTSPEGPSGLAPAPVRSHPWLNRCGTDCEQRLGASRIAFIDEQTCETLPEMYGVKRTENQAAWDAVIFDRAESLQCDGF